MSDIQTPIIPVVAEWIRECPGAISLGQGVAYYGPPDRAIKRLEEFHADPDNHRYRHVAGIDPLLRLLEEKLQCENGIGMDGRALVVSAGGNMAFINAVFAITDPGDEVILPVPYYFNHEMAILMSGCRPVCVPTDRHYHPYLEAIRSAVTSKTRAVVTVSPNNPTGAVYPAESLIAVNRFCRTAGIHHIHDEAYEYFTHGATPHFSPGSLPDSAEHTISLFSLSKSYGFASWRIGYMVIPEKLLVSVKKIQDTILICPPVISQYAAMGALEAGSSYCTGKLGPIREVREIAIGELDRVRSFCEVPTADGAFYLYLHVDSTVPSMTMVERLIREHGVAVLPGIAFGDERKCVLRASYGSLDQSTAVEGVRRLAKGLSALVAGS